MFSLLPHQVNGVRAIVRLHGRALLADEMGLGKTVTALAVSQHYGDRLVVVCPGYLASNWHAEVMRWLPKSSCQVVKSRRDLLLVGRLAVAALARAEGVRNIDAVRAAGKRAFQRSVAFLQALQRRAGLVLLLFLVRLLAIAALTGAESRCRGVQDILTARALASNS